jgi:hypothetical protein
MGWLRSHDRNFLIHKCIGYYTRILVVGSAVLSTKAKDSSISDEFANACYYIGQELGRSKCEVIIGSNRALTADHHVMRGLRSVPGTHRVLIVRPAQAIQVDERTGDSLHADDANAESIASEMTATTGSPGQLRVTYIPVRGPWGVGRVTQLLNCDAVIAIGSGKGTEQVIRLAPELRRPIVPIPSFGGSAREAWNASLHEFSHIGGRANDYYVLAQPWKNENAKFAIGLAKLLARRNPYDDGTRRFLHHVFGWNALLIGLWSVVFSYPCTLLGSPVVCSGNRVNILVLFWIAAFIGSGLRATQRALEDPTERSRGFFVLTEAAMGLAVSFGLSLIYMAGLFLASNDTKNFSLLSDEFVNNGDFRRNAVLMSAISFTSAFLLEGSFVRLQNKLREKILDEK